MAPAPVAVLLFQVDQSRNFIHDDLVPALSSALGREGIANDLFETTLPSLDGPDADDLSAVDALVDKLRGRYGVCAYVRLWSEAVFRRLREGLPGVVWVYLGDPRTAFEGTDHAITVGQVGTLAAIARAAGEGAAVPPEAFSIAPVALERAHVADNLVRIAVGPRRSPDRPAVVHGSPGCAYGQDVRENPHFRDVPFPEGRKVVLRGCSFCATGGVPRMPAGETLASVLAQLDHILATEPETARIQVNDQNPFPYLVQLVERVRARAARPMEILIETRADWFLGALPVLERALVAAERAGHRILLFLVGIENLSQKELDLYNKGVTVEENERAIHECRRLRRKHPAAWSDTPAAFGFVLWNPWTELSDLTLNLAAIERTGLGEFRGQIARSKLRLYPDTALYYKALHEGLVTARFAFDAMDSARRYGYEAEVPWRFKHPATERAYGAHDVIYRRAGKHEELKMLGELVRWLERHPERWDDAPERIARDVVKAMGPRFAQIRHTTSPPIPLSLPGEGGPDGVRAHHSPNRSDSPSPGRERGAGGEVPPASDRDAWRRIGDAARAARTEAEALEAAGLFASAPVTGREPARDPDAVMVPRLEEMAFLEGIKPALYLTVPRDEAPALLAKYREFTVETVDYARTRDDVTDRRERVNTPPGEGTHVDLFIARDPSAAKRAWEIYQTPRGPSERLAEMGEILGYPPCCVRAFEALDDRSNNTAIRYAAWARTMAEGRSFAWELNNLFAHVLPSFPCTYGCERAVGQARAVLAMFARHDPEGAKRLRARLARPVLYVDHARLVGLAGARRGGSVVRYDAAIGGLSPEPGDVGSLFERALVGALSEGNGVLDEPDALRVLSDGRAALTLARRAPALGRVFPFGL
jgi:hypothetical protein